MKKFIKICLVLLFVFSITSSVYAQNPCNMMGPKKNFMHDKKSNFCLKEKFMKKIKFLWLNQEEIGITDEQMQQIKDIKYFVKKELIKNDSKTGIIDIDIYTNYKKCKDMDIKALNKLIDEKYLVKAANSKAIIQASFQISNILTEEQINKAKAIHKKMMKEECKKF